MIKTILYSIIVVQFLVIAMIMLPIHYIQSNTDLEVYDLFALSIVKQYCGDNYKHPFKKLIYFDNLPKPEIGETTTDVMDMVIRFDSKYWGSASLDERMSVFLHEYAHAYLDKKHVKSPCNYMYEDNRCVQKSDVTIKQFTDDVKEYCSASH